MKKVLLFTSVLLFSFGAFAQKSNRENAKPMTGTKLHSIPLSMATQGINKKSRIGKSRFQMSSEAQRLTAPMQPQSILSASEHVIGTTTYDLQTNGTISNRFVNNADGSKSAVWTMSAVANPWADRGTGYNYKNTSGIWNTNPTARIEAFRTGFTNIAVASSNEEVVLAHSVTNLHGDAITRRPTKGTGTWTSTVMTGTDSSDLWTKMVAGGANGTSFHAIWQASGTALGPLYYSRSTDNGATWSAPIYPTLIDTSFYRGYGGDSYAIDARGDVVVILAGDLAMDLVLLKSTDNGVNWTKTIVDSFPIPFYNSATMNTDINGDGAGDTLFSNASDATVVLDNNDVAHVFFGGTRVLEQPGGTGLSYFRTFDLMYWNENMAPNASVLIATPPDLNHDSTITLPTGCGFDPANESVGYYGTGLVAFIEMPSAGVDAHNNIYCSYQAVDELSDTSLFGEAFMHPYIIKSIDGGANWTNSDDALDVVLATQPTAGQGYDGVYAAMAKRVDSKVHLTYQRDFAPGTTLSGATTATCESGNNLGAVNDIVYFGVDTNDIYILGMQEPASLGHSFAVSSNYPNPFTGKTSFDISLVKNSDVSVEVSNLLGEVLSVNKYSNLNSGFHTLTMDGNKLSSGIYFYKVQVGEEVVTNKMVVQ